MVHLKIKKGLDIPIAGQPIHDETATVPQGLFAYDLRPYERLHVRVLVEEGQEIQRGQSLAQEPAAPHRILTSPVAAKVVSIVRGEKRLPLEIVLSPLPTQPAIDPQLSLLEEPRPELVEHLMKAGILPTFRFRPFHRIANPGFLPRSIFVKAVETAPFVPSAERQVQGREKAFQTGLRVLQRLTDGPVHVVMKTASPLISLCQGLPCHIHTVEGPHPASNPSLHIQEIEPLQTTKEVVWVVTTLDVVRLGQYCLTGELWVDEVVAIAGTGIQDGLQRYVRAFPGTSIASLLGNTCINGPVRRISGDPLTGTQVTESDFLRYGHTSVTVLPEATSEQASVLHFLRIENKAYTATHAYLIPKESRYAFTTNQQGETRPFIDTALYDKVMPFKVLPMLMVKALLADDLDKAVFYGLLDIVPEDFALADFMCPSKISMMQVVKEGQEKSFHELFR